MKQVEFDDLKDTFHFFVYNEWIKNHGKITKVNFRNIQVEDYNPFFYKVETQSALEEIKPLQTKLSCTTLNNNEIYTKLSSLNRVDVKTFTTKENLKSVNSINPSTLTLIDKGALTKVVKVLERIDSKEFNYHNLQRYILTLNNKYSLRLFYEKVCTLSKFDPSRYSNHELINNPIIIKVGCFHTNGENESLSSRLKALNCLSLEDCFVELDVLNCTPFSRKSLNFVKELKIVAKQGNNIIWDSDVLEAKGKGGFELTQESLDMLNTLLKSNNPTDENLAYEILSTVDLKQYEMETYTLLLLYLPTISGRLSVSNLRKYFSGKNLDLNPSSFTSKTLEGKIQHLKKSFPSTPHNETLINWFVKQYLNSTFTSIQIESITLGR